MMLASLHPQLVFGHLAQAEMATVRILLKVQATELA
jgi:hypothetical protein